MAGKTIKFTEEARIEFHKVKCYMTLVGKEEDFWTDVDRQLHIALQYPEAFQVRYKNVRIITLERFNYSIHYVLKPYGILVYRFLMQNQDY
ncbi:hypothetical protein H7U19_01645 [Hyunsoonleella sp. SJ7]|uniref:Type II toxin-antitoxin system RelE/ParE family toxin n=1 Tax=Hyunsoonleella aquatilis TaxID=2762758 RepID=A0A923KHP7_9FLAO|nr:hypothetical protein [Hyunsoonleella aquatilis]MBC3757089.1 hypothetical protein [Hyunsoonleella aquatilis]